jgi:hypothetical protein
MRFADRSESKNERIGAASPLTLLALSFIENPPVVQGSSAP